MARLIQLDGKIHSFPDDATDDEIAAALGGTAPAAPAQQPGFVERAGRSLMMGTQDVGRGLAHIVASPITIPNVAANAGLSIADQFAGLWGGSVPFRFLTNQGERVADAAGGVAESAGVPLVDWKDRAPRERLAGNAIDNATQALVGGSALALKAPSMAAGIAANEAPGIGSSLVMPYAEKPLRALLTDAAGGAGVGVGQTVAEDIAPNNPWVALGLSLLGGVGGAGLSGAAQSLGEVFRSLKMKNRPDLNVPINAATGKPYSQAEVEAAARQMQDLVGVKIDPYGRTVAAPEKAAEVGQTIRKNADELRGAGFTDQQLPTSGLLSDNPAMVTAERQRRLTDGVPFVERDSAVKQAGAEKIASVQAPGADQSRVAAAAGTARDAALQPAQGALATAQREADAAMQARQAEGAGLGVRASDTTRTDASRRLDTAVVDETYLPARAEKNALYDAVDPQRSAYVDAQPVLDAAARVREGVNALGPQAQILPGEFVQRIERLAPGPNADMSMVPVGDLVDLRKYLATARENARRAGNFELADNISALGRGIDEATAASPEAATASANYRENFAPTYRPGPGDEMAGFTKAIDRDATRSTTPPEQTAGRFLAAPEKAAALQRVLAQSPSAEAGQAAVTDWLVSDMAKSVLNPDGTINPARAGKWAQANASVLEHFPQAAAEVQQIVAGSRLRDAAGRAAQERLQSAQKGMQNAEAEVANGAIGTLLNKDPRTVAAEILDSKWEGGKKLAEVDKIIGADKAARDGWKAAVADELVSRVTRTAEDAAGNYEVAYAKLASEFKRNEKLLAQVFSPEEMANLRQAHKLLSYFKNAEKRATVGSQTAENIFTGPLGMATQLAIRHVHGDLKGGGIIRRFRLVASLLPTSKDAVNDISKMAFFNPDVAAYLLGKKVRNFSSQPNNINLRRLIVLDAAGNAGEPDQK